jgi:hypothetical protein
MISPLGELIEVRAQHPVGLADPEGPELPGPHEPPGYGTAHAQHRGDLGQRHDLWFVIRHHSYPLM